MLNSRNLLLRTALLLRVANVCCSNTTMSNSKCTNMRTSFLAQAQARALDEELFNEYKFSVDQLMELAGLSVASAIPRVYPASTHPNILVICGPGNNGGDGLVAARHLMLFGYKVSIYYPKQTPNQLYENLLDQAKRFGVNVVDKLPDNPTTLRNDYHVLVDALFGFSFKPPVRSEFIRAMDALIDSTLPVCSVDIPSGWDVEKGPVAIKSLQPSMIVSLSVPKLCTRLNIIGDIKHFLGGRFIPPEIIQKYDLTLPSYPEQDQIVQLSC